MQLGLSPYVMKAELARASLRLATLCTPRTLRPHRPHTLRLNRTQPSFLAPTDQTAPRRQVLEL